MITICNLPHFIFAQSNNKLTIHGYLTQGFGITNRHQVYGLPNDGTFDYRNLALQFRFDMNPKSAFVIQLSHKRLGKSPIMIIEPDVELDWGFIEHWISKTTSVKVGKVQLPMGTYNELRDVGIVLPFYRAPESVYREGTYTSETVDGLVLSHIFAESSPWNLELDVYGGTWRWVEFFNNPITNETVVKTASVDFGYGFQSWLYSPIDKLRFGIGAHKAKSSDGLIIQKANYVSWIYSVDTEIDRYSFKAEYRNLGMQGNLKALSYYAQTGARFSDNWIVNIQFEVSELSHISMPELLGGSYTDIRMNEDFGFGLNYLLQPNLILKLELHRTKGFNFENKFVNIFSDDPEKVNYMILSLSSSF